MCGGGCAGWGVEYLPGGPSHSCHVLRQGQTWNKEALEQTQHSCHAGGQAPQGAGKGVCPDGWGGDWVTREGPEHPTCLIPDPDPPGMD